MKLDQHELYSSENADCIVIACLLNANYLRATVKWEDKKLFFYLMFFERTVFNLDFVFLYVQ